MEDIETIRKICEKYNHLPMTEPVMRAAYDELKAAGVPDPIYFHGGPDLAARFVNGKLVWFRKDEVLK